MAVKARDQVTISIGVDVASVDTYYKLQASTAAVPQKPTTASPSGWSTTEPGYDGTTTNTLYTCQKTTLTDGTFYWGAVSKSSSYEAAKQAANGVNSLSQTVTTLSNNYATFKQETETFESTVGTTYAKKVEIDELVSRGEQLVVNGSLFMGDNTNFPPELVFDGSMSNGTKGSVTRAPGSSAVDVKMVDWFPIDANGDYYCSLDVIRDNSGNGKAYLYAYMNYRDVDKNVITYQHWHSMKRDGDTLTQLAQDLKSGDTKIYLNDISHYVLNYGNNNSFIVWDWTNTFGYTYPPNTYSRHFISGWTKTDSSAFNTSENSITLTNAYSGQTIPAGTWISQVLYGNTYQYFVYNFVPDTWTTWGHIVGASYTDGGGYSIPSAAAEAKIGFLWNYYSTGASQGPTTEQARIWATNISVTKMGAIDNKLGTEISQRKAQFGICTTAAGTAAKAVALADFSLYTGAQIAVRFNSGNTAGSPTLNVNSTGARQIVVNGSASPAAKYVTWNAYANCTFVYDGTYWRFTGSDQDMVKTVDVESRVSTAETSITQNRNNIALKANASDVYTKTQTDGLISTEVTNRNSAIEQSAAAIKLGVTQTLNSIENGSANLISNQLINWSKGSLTNSVYGYSGSNRFIPIVEPQSGRVWQVKSSTKYIFKSIDTSEPETEFYVGIHEQDSSGTHLNDSGWKLCSTSGYSFITLSNTATIKIVVRKGDNGTDLLDRIENGTLSFTFSEDMASKSDLEIAKSEIKVTTDGISSTVSKISSIKYVIAAATSWPLASIKTYAAEGHSENWGVNSTDGLRVGDTVYVKGTDGTRNCTVYIKTTVTAISSSTIFTGVSHGYEDVLPVDTIKSTINQSSDSVKIQAKHVEIDGAAIFSNTAFRQAADAVYDGSNLYVDGESIDGYLAGSGNSIATASSTNKERTSAFIKVSPSEKLLYQVWMKSPNASAFWIAYSFYTAEDMSTTLGRPAVYTSTLAPNGYYYNSYSLLVPANAEYIRISFRTYGDYIVKLEHDAIPTKVSELTNDSNFQTSSQVETTITNKGYATTTQAQGYADTAKAQAIAASYANMGFQFKKDIIIYGDSDKYYPVYLNNTQAEYGQSAPHEVVVTRGYSEQAPSDWNTSTHKGGLNLRLRWNYGGWGGATYVCQIYDFSELYSKMLGDVLVGNKSGMNSTIYLRGGGTTGALYHIYSEVSIENTRYGATFPYIGTDEPGTVYMQSGSYTFTVDNPLTTPNTAHILSLAATVDEQYIYISKASGTTSVASTTTWVTAYTDSQNAWTTKRPTYNSSYPVLFVAKQRKTAFGLVTCTTPVKDDTTTVIDGGHITTGTIDTNRLNADTIRSNIIQTTDIQASRVMMMSGEQTQSLEAYRESVSNNIGEMVSNETFQQKIQALDEALEEKLSQEDVDTLVNTAISDVEESIANNYVANADLDDAVQTLNDTLSNLGMTYATTEALSELSDSLNITSQDLIQLTSYIYADNVDDGAGGTVPVLFLGSKQSKVQAMLSNNVLNFIYRANPDDPGTVVAYIGAEETDTNATGKLYVIEAVVVNEISFGHWSFFERQNHNMAIKWIGE